MHCAPAPSSRWRASASGASVAGAWDGGAYSCRDDRLAAVGTQRAPENGPLLHEVHHGPAMCRSPGAALAPQEGNGHAARGPNGPRGECDSTHPVVIYGTFSYGVLL